MKLTALQRVAIERAVEWYFVKTDEQQCFVVAGYAGSGKTTIVSHMITVLGLTKYNVLYVAYTGKAVNVLRTKGNFAHTIHRTFYQIYKNGGKVSFKLKTSLPSIIKLIVVDEMSMVNDKLMDDILSFGIPVIGLGDPGQLPPIFGGNKFIHKSDVFLTEVMRTDDASGILDLATRARNGDSIPFGGYGASRCVTFDKIGDMEKYDTVLCWKNETRAHLNKIIRGKLGITHMYPLKGEKLICLKNNYIHEIDVEGISMFIVNGLNCISLSEAMDLEDTDNTFRLKFKPDFAKTNDVFFETKCTREIFDAYLSSKPWADSSDNELDEQIACVDYGYALTVHKSQGSEWRNVLIIDEYGGARDTYLNWLYTAITRGRTSVTLTRM